LKHIGACAVLRPHRYGEWAARVALAKRLEILLALTTVLRLRDTTAVASELLEKPRAMDMTSISRFDEHAEFYTPERCYIVEIHNNESDANCSIARARVVPGETTQLHAVRGTMERYVILAGKGAVEVDGGAPTAVAPLDVGCIPAGKSQKITNTGDVDLLFLCVCTPRFRKENYVPLGD
jgi:mannose-6-phosphate isomerase-like protein (cupin superfamily)